MNPGVLVRNWRNQYVLIIFNIYIEKYIEIDTDVDIDVCVYPQRGPRSSNTNVEINITSACILVSEHHSPIKITGLWEKDWFQGWAEKVLDENRTPCVARKYVRASNQWLEHVEKEIEVNLKEIPMTKCGAIWAKTV